MRIGTLEGSLRRRGKEIRTQKGAVEVASAPDQEREGGKDEADELLVISQLIFNDI